MNRWAVALVALVLGGSELGSAGHAALVRHALCAEHGEPVHAGSSVTAAGIVTVTDSVVPSESAKASPDEHDHCKILAGASRIAPSERSLAIPLSLCVDAGLAAGEAVVDPSVAVFRLAPKTSPPVAG